MSVDPAADSMKNLDHCELTGGFSTFINSIKFIEDLFLY